MVAPFVRTYPIHLFGSEDKKLLQVLLASCLVEEGAFFIAEPTPFIEISTHIYYMYP